MITHPRAEHMYQYKKCINVKRSDLALQVMKTNSPFDAMRISKQAYVSDEWTYNEGKNIMTQVVKAKVAQVPEFRNLIRSYKDKKFVEATTNRQWGIGVRLTAPGIEDKTKWTGSNLLGKIYGKIYDGSN